MADLPSPQAHGRHASRPLQILYAEDDPQLRAVILMYLESARHHVTVAHDGMAALEMFRPKAFDVVLTDFAMPRMNGQELAVEVKKRHPPQLVVLLTGSVEALRWTAGKPDGADLLILKPITSEVLNKALGDLVT